MSGGGKAVEKGIDILVMVGRLLPDFARWLRAMLNLGHDEATIRRDITDRSAELERVFERQREDIERKHGRTPD